MKNILKYLFLATVACGVTSCEDFLSPEPTANLSTQYYYQTDEQIEAAVTSLYVPLRTASFLGSTYTLNFHGFSDEDMHNGANSDRVNNFSQTATNTTVQAFWTQGYSALKNIAYLLEGMEKNKEKLSETVYKNAKGEALFLRGFYHFNLIQWFCHPDTGIPMLLNTITSYEEAAMPLATLDEHFIQIEQDMKAAEELLIETGQTWTSLGYSERVTVTAIQGILARVALHAAGFPNNGGSNGSTYYYELAKEYADKVISGTYGVHKLEDEYSEVFIAPAQDRYVSENIWEIGYQYLGSGNSEYNTGGAVGNQFGIGRSFTYQEDADGKEMGTTLSDSLIVSNTRYMHPRLLVSYGQVGDDRRTWNHGDFTYENNTGIKIPKNIFTGTYVSEMRGSASSNTTAPLYEYPVSYMWTAPVGKWRREYEERIERDGNSTTTNYPLLRYADVLLMAAEARIELNKEMSTAVKYIQDVRSRSIKNSSTYMITHVVLNDAGAMIRGYSFVPEIEVVSPGSGTGFVPRVACDKWGNSNQGRLSIGVLDPGKGYDVPPTLKVAEARKVTWKANTVYKAGDFVTAPTTAAGTAMRVYRAYTSGTSTDVYPTTTETGDTDANTTGDECGLTWVYESGTYTTDIGGAYAPEIRAICGKSVSPIVSDHVSTSDQASLRQFLRDERARELCFESLRRLDLRRWGVLYDTVQSIAADYDGGEGIIPVSVNASTGGGGSAATLTAAGYATRNNVNYLPIPQTQLTLNRNLKQNPGY